MARRFPAQAGPDDLGQFVVARTSESEIDIYYKFSPNRRAPLRLTPEVSTTFRLLKLHEANDPLEPDDLLTMYPVHTLPDPKYFLTPKYICIESITLEGFGFEGPRTPDDVYEILRTLPPGFVKDPEYGLGLQKDFKFIINAVEANPRLRHLVISKRRKSSIDGDTHCIRASDFDAIRKGLNRTHADALNRASINKKILAHNALMTAVDPVSYPEQQRPYTKDCIFKVVSGQGSRAAELSKADSSSVLSLVSKNKHNLAQTHPNELLKLQRDIELVTLERLIAKIEDKIAKRVTEPDWQLFFTGNPFILSLAFGLPMVVIGEKVAVGGMAISCKGEKYTDFLLKNDLTDNLTLVEIKTAKSQLLSKAYRDGVHHPATQLSGAVSQVLDQRYQLQKGLALAKDNSRRNDMESYAIRCIVVIGLMPTNADEKKSLELYRNALNDVLVVTFDELLAKLKQLLTFLQAAPEADTSLK